MASWERNIGWTYKGQTRLRREWLALSGPNRGEQMYPQGAGRGRGIQQSWLSKVDPMMLVRGAGGSEVHDIKNCDLAKVM